MKELSIGLVVSPELPDKIANEIIDDLPDIFSNRISSQISWKFKIVVNPLTGAAETHKEIIDEAIEIKKAKTWDYILCLTDLPLFSEKNVVLADINFQENISRISLPAFGLTPVRRRLIKTMAQVVKELYIKDSDTEQFSSLNSTNDDSKTQKTKRLIKKPFSFLPVRRITSPSGMNKTDIRYLLYPRVNGRMRLLMGMTHANRPWTIIASFKPIIAIAFGTGAYVLIFPTLWSLSVAFTSTRLIGLMGVAIISMVIWMIASHKLWEEKTTRNNKKLRRLYNHATVSTLLFAVLVYYLMLFIIFLIAVTAFVPPDLFSSKANIEGGVNWTSFVNLAWLATSVATLAGSIGASVENEELVRNVAYGYRQKRRYHELNKED